MTRNAYLKLLEFRRIILNKVKKLIIFFILIYLFYQILRWSVKLELHIGHRLCTNPSRQLAHNTLWPQGTNACVLGLSKHTIQISLWYSCGWWSVTFAGTVAYGSSSVASVTVTTSHWSRSTSSDTKKSASSYVETVSPSGPTEITLVITFNRFFMPIINRVR